MGVLPGSSAETAGLRKDDVIETVDGKPAGSYELHQLRELFKSSSAKGWNLGIRRGNETKTVWLPAKSII
jgi:C-terminal processing protease CtpA/Prc